jgi:hypothetical protein
MHDKQTSETSQLGQESGTNLVRAELLRRLVRSSKITLPRFSLLTRGGESSNAIRMPQASMSISFASQWTFQPMSRFGHLEQGLSNSSKVGDGIATPDFIYFENGESELQPLGFLRPSHCLKIDQKFPRYDSRKPPPTMGFGT